MAKFYLLGLLVVVFSCGKAFSQYEGDVRLADGATTREGRPEIYHSGQWGSVCDDGFDTNDARVICRQLGRSGGAARTDGFDPFYGEGSGMIWLSELKCTGKETSLSSCPHMGWGSHVCTHREDAGVICDGNEMVPLRLADGSTSREGRVEVYYDDQWGSMCDNYMDLANANVICYQLGFGTALNFRRDAFFRPGSGPVWLSSVDCSGLEDGLNECDHNGWGYTSICDHGDDVGVICNGDEVAQLRLADGSTSREGRVEVFYDNRWGTICDDFAGTREVSVICRNLGYYGGGVLRDSAFFQQGSGDIWVKSLDCPTGNEKGLNECNHSGWGNTDWCDHDEDLGVICDGDEVVPVRLADGSSNNEGRLEVLYQGLWGTVCDDYFDVADAEVACRQLGYQTGTVAWFLPGSGNIWLTNMSCSGSELGLNECSHAGWGPQYGCSHDEDVGVVCS